MVVVSHRLRRVRTLQNGHGTTRLYGVRRKRSTPPTRIRRYGWRDIIIIIYIPSPSGLSSLVRQMLRSRLQTSVAEYIPVKEKK